MADDVVYAVFEPSEPQILSTVPQAHLLVDNPILASALSNIFPYLLFIDNFLEVITWTNNDFYLNFLIMVFYSVLVRYWSLLRLFIVPMLLATTFSSVVWNTSSVIFDSKFGEKPTVEEVLSLLHNITVRFELLLRPAKHVNLTVHNYWQMVLGGIVVTPVHYLALKYVMSSQTYVWIIGILVFSYHSPYSYATRRLLWRSAYLRWAVHYLTGLNIRLTRTDSLTKSRGHDTISRTHSPASTDVEELPQSTSPDKVYATNNFTILKKVIVSKTQLKQTVRFDVLENERRWLGLGWSKYLTPNERATFCYDTSMSPAPDPHSDAEFIFPVYENDLYTYQWQWMDDEWKLDTDFNKSKDSSGWVYYDNNWDNATYADGYTKFTRSRKWTRRAILLIDKHAEVYDE